MHPSCDDLKIGELKRRKLLVKDEIARLPQDIGVTLTGANALASLSS
jgi:hypothetical protein